MNLIKINLTKLLKNLKLKFKKIITQETKINSKIRKIEIQTTMKFYKFFKMIKEKKVQKNIEYIITMKKMN